MTELKIATHHNQTEFRPGETIAGGVGWKLNKPAKRIEVRLFWRTRGHADESLEIVDRVQFDQPPFEGAQPFQFQLPDSPYSFAGKLITLTWALEAVVLPGGDATRLEFTLSPSGRAIVLSLQENRQGSSPS